MPGDEMTDLTVLYYVLRTIAQVAAPLAVLIALLRLWR
jgi:hypothetical protein